MDKLKLHKSLMQLQQFDWSVIKTLEYYEGFVELKNKLVAMNERDLKRKTSFVLKGLRNARMKMNEKCIHKVSFLEYSV